jgi:hypothetical protein
MEPQHCSHFGAFQGELAFTRLISLDFMQIILASASGRYVHHHACATSTFSSQLRSNNQHHAPRMTIYALYIYDRHCECIYYHDWHQTRKLQPPRDGSQRKNVARYEDVRPVAEGEVKQQQQQGEGRGQTTVAGLPFDEQAKLVYGVLLSLRNMVKKLSGRYVLPPHLHPRMPLTRFADLKNNSSHTVHQHTNSTSTPRRQTYHSSCSVTRSRIPSEAY